MKKPYNYSKNGISKGSTSERVLTTSRHIHTNTNYPI